MHWLVVLTCLIAAAQCQFSYGDEYTHPVFGYFPFYYNERLSVAIVNAARIDPVGYRNSYATDFTPVLPPTIMNPPTYNPTTPVWHSFNVMRAAKAHSQEMATFPCFSHPSCANPAIQPSDRVDAVYSCAGSGTYEDIAAGYVDGRVSVNQWNCDAVAGVCAADGSGNDGHRSNINQAVHRFLGAGYYMQAGSPYIHYWTHDFVTAGCATEPEGTLPSFIYSGSHVVDYPTAGQIHFLAAYHDSVNSLAPTTAELVIGGACYPMSKTLGASASPGIWSATMSKVVGPCRAYFFHFRSATGTDYYYPASGSLLTVGEGSCTSATWWQAGQTPCHLCGNGIVEVGEGCDDGALTGGDGCSSTCAVEFNYNCVGSPSLCTQLPDCNNVAFSPGGLGCFGGTCVDGTPLDMAFTCDCTATAFVGANCNLLPGDCAVLSNGPGAMGCQNGGLCVDSVPGDNSFTCLCTTVPALPFTGTNCQTPVTDCGSSTNGPGAAGCFNGGTCIDGTPNDGAFTCDCGTSFTGPNCLTATDCSYPTVLVTSVVLPSLNGAWTYAGTSNGRSYWSNSGKNLYYDSSFNAWGIGNTLSFADGIFAYTNPGCGAALPRMCLPNVWLTFSGSFVADTVTISCPPPDLDQCALGISGCLSAAAHGYCVNTATGFSCYCGLGYTGDGSTSCNAQPDCSTYVNGPFRAGCANGGLCVDGGLFDQTFTCDCSGTGGFTGPNCQIPPGLSASASPSLSASGTASVSESASRTVSVSTSATVSDSGSETPSAGASTTATGSTSASPSPASPSPSPQSASASASASGSASPSVSPSVSPSPAAAASASPSPASPSVSPTRSSSPVSPTASPSAAASSTSSASATRSGTRSPSKSPVSVTPTASVSETSTASLSFGATPSNSATRTETRTPTRSSSETGSNTPTRTVTISGSISGSRSDSASFTPSRSDSGSVSASQSITASRTPSRSVSPVTPSKVLTQADIDWAPTGSGTITVASVTAVGVPLVALGVVLLYAMYKAAKPKKQAGGGYSTSYSSSTSQEDNDNDGYSEDALGEATATNGAVSTAAASAQSAAAPPAIQTTPRGRGTRTSSLATDVARLDDLRQQLAAAQAAQGGEPVPAPAPGHAAPSPSVPNFSQSRGYQRQIDAFDV